MSNSSYYWISNGGGVDNGRLIIEPGVIIQMESGKQFEIDTEGSMRAVGTASDPIIFRGSTPGTPSWNAIFFRSQSVDNVMQHCIIREAGLGTILTAGCNGEASIGLFYWAGTGSRLNISNCTIRNGNGCGIFTSINNIGNLTESGNTFTNVSGANICN